MQIQNEQSLDMYTDYRNTNPFKEVCFLGPIWHFLDVLIERCDFGHCSLSACGVEAVRADLLAVGGVHLQRNVFILRDSHMTILYHTHKCIHCILIDQCDIESQPPPTNITCTCM